MHVKAKDKCVLLAAGGTGGHLYSAKGTSEELKRRGYKVILFTDRRIEGLLDNFFVDQTKFILSATFSKKNIIYWPYILIKLLYGLAISIYWITYYKPSLAVGFGGYPTVPPLLAAKICGLKIIIHEQNSIMGRANLFLSNFTNGLTKGFKDIYNLPEKVKKKSCFSGNPIRDEVTNEINPYLAYNGKIFNILVFGGSQGASFFSKLIPRALSKLPDNYRKKLNIMHQSRTEEINSVRDLYISIGIKAEVNDFFYDLPKRLRNSHLVISRAGASTISELSLLGRPGILIPLPSSIDGDQEYNAKVLDSLNGAIVYHQSDINEEILSDKIFDLISSPSELLKIANNAKAASKGGGSKNIVDFIENLLTGKLVWK